MTWNPLLTFYCPLHGEPVWVCYLADIYRVTRRHDWVIVWCTLTTAWLAWNAGTVMWERPGTSFVCSLIAGYMAGIGHARMRW